METQRRLPIQARRPVVNYLPKLPDEALHIIDLFLRKPHPTAVMIAELTFRRDFYEDGIEIGYFVENLPAMRYTRKGYLSFSPLKYFEDGECVETGIVERVRLRRLKENFLRERGSNEPLAPDSHDIVQEFLRLSRIPEGRDSLIEFLSLHLDPSDYDFLSH